jgi:hypothetical protein
MGWRYAFKNMIWVRVCGLFKQGADEDVNAPFCITDQGQEFLDLLNPD